MHSTAYYYAMSLHSEDVSKDQLECTVTESQGVGKSGGGGRGLWWRMKLAGEV